MVFRHRRDTDEARRKSCGPFNLDRYCAPAPVVTRATGGDNEPPCALCTAEADVSGCRERQRRGATPTRAEALAAFSLSLDNSISILAWIFSQSTSTWRGDTSPKTSTGLDKMCPSRGSATAGRSQAVGADRNRLRPSAVSFARRRSSRARHAAAGGIPAERSSFHSPPRRTAGTSCWSPSGQTSGGTCACKPAPCPRGSCV